MKLAVFGASGRMGNAVLRLAKESGDIDVVAAIDESSATTLCALDANCRATRPSPHPISSVSPCAEGTISSKKDGA